MTKSADILSSLIFTILNLNFNSHACLSKARGVHRLPDPPRPAGLRLLWDDLTANPIEYITRFTGSWSLIILLASLAVTPLRRLTGWNEVIKLRRMLGLFAFGYAALHFSTYMVLDFFFDFAAIAKDILKRPYITVGFSALVLMIPLAVTSTAGMIRRLGKRWQQLHYLVYGIAILGVLHFYWLVKADIRRPLQYGAVLTVLLGSRLAFKLRRS